jgi:hypothetical protein
MTEIDLENLRAALAKHAAHKVIAYRGDDVLRAIPVPPGRKRNAAVLAVVGKLEWSRVELVDRTGGLLAVVDGSEDGRDDAPAVEPTGREAYLLNLMLKAQQVALSHREKETAIALNACTQSVRMLTDAVGALAGLHRKALDAQAEAHSVSIAAAIEAAQAAQAAGGGDDLMSGKLMEQLAPVIMARLMAPAPAPAPAGPANGSNGVKS